MRVRLLISSLIIFCCVDLAHAQAPDAVVVSVSGKAYASAGPTTKPILLKKGDGLYAGQWIRCAAGCKDLTISYCNMNFHIPNSPKWERIYSIHCASVSDVRGGSPKGEGVLIISPKESETIRPKAFSLRWKPYKYPKKIKLELRVSLGEKLWSAENINGSKGLFESPSLRAVLKKAQKEDYLRLVLMLEDGNELPQIVKFHLISVEAQQELNEKLKVFNSETNPILKAMGRGSLFGEYELYTEAAEEFEKALAISRRLSVDNNSYITLIKLAIMANYKAYNDERVKQLCKSSKVPISSLPYPCARVQ
jgi:tetratricopeptide (TPR) repeat protein